MIKDISAVIITKNALPTLKDTLASLKDFEEVLVYDNGSDDGTLELLRETPNVRLEQGEFMGFGPTKQHAVNLASNDWVLSLDADETLTPELLDELKHWTTQHSADTVAYVLRNNFFLGQQVRYSGWGNDWLIRLFNRQHCNFNDAMVHENITVPADSKKVRLKAPINHAAVTELNQFLTKVNRYSDIRAATMKKKHHPAVTLLKAMFAFFRTYILKLGILDGWPGLVISVSNANGVFWKNIKRYYRDKN